MRTPEGLSVVWIKIFWRRNVSARFVPFHLAHHSANVVFGVAEVHQLPLIGRFENCVAHLFSMGQQAKTALALR